MDTTTYNPFTHGRFRVGARTVQAHDAKRDRLFPCEIWYPAAAPEWNQQAGPQEERAAAPDAGPLPLIAFSHGSGGHRRSSTFLCIHLASHGYAVAAMDHSEVIAANLAGQGSTADMDPAARIDAIIAGRVPDLRFLLDFLLGGGVAGIEFDPARVGLVGYSFGGWTVLATAEAEPRVRSVVALGPGGSSQPRPGILPVTLTFEWGRDVPTMYLAAENDILIPLSGVIELFDRTPASKRLFILRRADHEHFLDDVEAQHEALRAMSLSGDAAWIPAAMKPITELCSGEHAHLFARSLTLAHLDATLRQRDAAEAFLAGNVVGELAAHGVEAIAHGP